MPVEKNLYLHGWAETVGIAATSGDAVLTMTARVHLLWALVEDALRNEVNYRPAVVERWRDNLDTLSRSIRPLEWAITGVVSAAALRERPRLRHAIPYFKERLQKARGYFERPELRPVGQIYSALAEIRRARLAIKLLFLELSRIGRWDDGAGAHLRGMVPTAVAEPALREAYEAMLAVRHASDDSLQCQASRQLYLLLYQLMTYDEDATRIFHQPALSIHAELVDRMPPGVTRECVRGRLEVLETLSPDQFEVAALRLAGTTANLPGTTSEQ